MRRNWLIVLAGLVILSAAVLSAQTTTTSTAPADDGRCSITMLGYEYGAAWERVDDLLNKKERDWPKITSEVILASRLLHEQCQSIGKIRERLRALQLADLKKVEMEMRQFKNELEENTPEQK